MIYVLTYSLQTLRKLERFDLQKTKVNYNLELVMEYLICGETMTNVQLQTKDFVQFLDWP